MMARVLAAVEDIFFAAKIRAAAEAAGVEVAFPRSDRAFNESAANDAPALVVCDLQSQRHDPFALAAAFKSDERLKGVPLVGFFSHVETELKRRAEAAGFDHVLPRSAFSQRLPDILLGKL
jgi:PleD family two-component response regulator